MKNNKIDDITCFNCDCSFCIDNECAYGGLFYERPCYEDKGYFEDEE